jgi:hypothetical protein
MESSNNVCAHGVISVLLFWEASAEVGGNGFRFTTSAANRLFQIFVVFLKYNKIVHVLVLPS